LAAVTAAGTFGSQSAIPVITVDGKGRVTGVTTAAAGVTSINGTTDQISVTTVAGVVTLSLPSSVTIGGTFTSTNVSLTGAAATFRQLSFRTAGVLRWNLYADALAETGSDAGSNLVLSRHSDAGASLGAAVSIDRATGAVTVGGMVTLPSTTPTNATHATTKAYVDAGDALQVAKTGDSMSGALTMDSGVPINVNGSQVVWATAGVAAPTSSTRSAGTKLVLWPDVGVSKVDYAIGIENNTQWFSVPTASQQFKWYASTTAIATLSGTGALTATSFTGNGAGLTSLAASALTGTVAAARMPAFTGDATSSAGSTALTLANSGVTANTYGSGAAIPVITVDSKGRVTTLSTVANSAFQTAGNGLASSGTTVSMGTPSTLTAATANATTATSHTHNVDAVTAATASTIVGRDASGFINAVTFIGGGNNTAGVTGGSGAVLRVNNGTNRAHFNWTGSEFRIYVDTSLVKTFVIDHPVDGDKYLVHACAEGPTADVFYRGEDALVDGRCEIQLPDYFEALTEPHGRTVSLTPIVDNPDNRVTANLAASRVVEGRFTVFMTSGAVNETQSFFWRVDAIRKNTAFNVEPNKAETVVGGEGPYTYVMG
jgi:hypothetical protein